MPVDWTINPTSGTPIVPGGVRQLTIGEIALARTLFGGSIIYSKVWVHLEIQYATRKCCHDAKR